MFNEEALRGMEILAAVLFPCGILHPQEKLPGGVPISLVKSEALVFAQPSKSVARTCISS